jgi:hypothetical protein
MLYLVTDDFGKSAFLNLPFLDHSDRLWLSADGIMEAQTGKVLRAPSGKYTFNSNVPHAEPIYGRTKLGNALVGVTKTSWHLGYYADNGFCIPGRKVLANYHLIVKPLVNKI